MNSTLQRTRVRLLAGISGAVALSVLAVAGCSAGQAARQCGTEKRRAGRLAFTTREGSRVPTG